MRWIAWGALASIVGTLAVSLFIIALGLSLQAGLWISNLFLVALPLSVAVAILRENLFDIDLIINRTLVYVPLTAILAGVFSATVSLTQKLFVSATGQTSDAAVAFTTIIVVALFDPLKSRLQKLVERRFKEARDPARNLTAFNTHAKAVLGVMDPDAFQQSALDEAVKAFGASGGALHVGVSDQAVATRTAGAWQGDEVISVPLNGAGGPLGRLSLSARKSGAAYTAADRKLLQQTADLLARVCELRGG